MMYRILILTVLAVWLILTLVGIGVVFRGDGEKSLAVPAPETEEPVEAQWQETEPPVPDSMEPTETSVTVPQEEIPLQTEIAEFHWKPTEETQPTESPRQDQPNQTFLPVPKSAVEAQSVEKSLPEEQRAVADPEPEIPEETATGLNAMDTGLDILRRCWLYTPTNPQQNMPLIVYLHGGSGKGDDLNLITAVDGFPSYLQSGSFGNLRAYVLIPQLPAEQKGWAEVSDQLYELIQNLLETRGIDRGNISLTGHSMGGTGTWSIGAAYPSLFARIAPLSGSVRSPESTAAKLSDTPVWAFVGSEDTIVPPESSEQTIGWLMELSDQAKITVLEGADHFSVPSLAYLDGERNLVGWLIGG